MFNNHPFNLMQRSACGGIDIGAAYDCDNPVTAGVNQRLILIDKQVFDNAVVTYDVGTPNLITNITLGIVGDAGFAFQGVRKSLNPQSAFSPTSVTVQYDHQVDFLCFDISAAQKNNIEKMGTSPVVAIVENSNSIGNADSVFEVFGTGVGMFLQAGPLRINGDLESSGAFTLSLKSSDDFGKEPHMPNSFWDTDYSTTKAKVDAILIPVV